LELNQYHNMPASCLEKKRKNTGVSSSQTNVNGKTCGEARRTEGTASENAQAVGKLMRRWES